MKTKKKIIYGIFILILLSIIAILTIKILSNPNRLNNEERSWLNNNLNSLQNVYVVKDENIFSKDDNGVFYKFLNDFTDNYGIKVNIINTDTNNEQGNSFNYTNNLSNNDKVFYKDHYVIIGKNFEVINDTEYFNDKVVGTLKDDINYLNNYINNITFKSYDDINKLIDSINKGETSYIVLSRIKYLNEYLKCNYEIVYHLSDINNYYTFKSNNDIFGNILNKYFNIWEKNIDKEMKKEEFKLFKSSLSINEIDIDKLLSIDYNYGFINNSPYEVIMNGKYGGILSRYLQEFSEFSGVYFNIKKYNNLDKLSKALNKGKVDIYFSFNYGINDNYLSTTQGINSSISIITNRDNEMIFNSINGLKGHTVYVEENSNISTYLSKIGNITIKTYKNNKELFKLNNKDVIIAMDKYIYDYYKNSKLNNYVDKYNGYIDYKYSFKINSNYSSLNNLLSKYMGYLDESKIINDGLNSHRDVVSIGEVLNKLALYIILLVVFVMGSLYFYYKRSKKTILHKKMKKDDRIRFIDDLTCLKNRSYLSDFLKIWNNNKIYPQAIIILDLNKLQEINDKYGLKEGDKQIQSAANALIKTQLDNSELMRSDGNEFVIYTIGYDQKKIINYIHKLNRELKKMPYDFGAEFGYSMILDNVKSVEDALQEATLDMKRKKSDKHE